MTAIASLLLSKGLPILASAILSGVIKKGGGKLWDKFTSKLGLKKKASEEEVKDKLERGLTKEEFDALLEFQYDVRVEEEVTKRLEIDNNADSWLTKHIRPLALIVVTAATIIFFFTAMLMDIETPQQADLIEVLGNYLFMLNAGIFSFYFGGRSWEKVERVKLAKTVADAKREELATRREKYPVVNEEDIPKI